MKNKKQTTKKQYKILAMVWMLAAAAVAVALIRRIAYDFNLILLLMLVLSLLMATGFWKTYKTAPEEDGANEKRKKTEEEDYE